MTFASKWAACCFSTIGSATHFACEAFLFWRRCLPTFATFKSFLQHHQHPLLMLAGVIWRTHPRLHPPHSCGMLSSAAHLQAREENQVKFWWKWRSCCTVICCFCFGKVMQHIALKAYCGKLNNRAHTFILLIAACWIKSCTWFSSCGLTSG